MGGVCWGGVGDNDRGGAMHVKNIKTLPTISSSWTTLVERLVFWCFLIKGGIRYTINKALVFLGLQLVKVKEVVFSSLD